jgi:hypothetical protein
MNDTTTWSTDEVERWIDNDYDLYRLVTGQGTWMDYDEMWDMLSAIDWQAYNGDIDPDEVDYDYLARQYVTETEPEPERAPIIDIIINHEGR